MLNERQMSILTYITEHGEEMCIRDRPTRKQASLKAASHCSVLRVQGSMLKGFAPLAQLVEQLTLNQWVPGSSP